MKKLSTVIIILVAIVASSCSGSDGLDGLDGKDGVENIGTVFEITGDFNAAGNYEISYTFPLTTEVFESDVVTAYRLDGETDNGNKIWTALPQTIFFNDGSSFQYNFNYTFNDVVIFMDGAFDLATFHSDWKTGQTFRVAVLPADYASSTNLNTNNLSDVMNSLNITTNDIVKVKN